MRTYKAYAVPETGAEEYLGLCTNADECRKVKTEAENLGIYLKVKYYNVLGAVALEVELKNNA